MNNHLQTEESNMNKGLVYSTIKYMFTMGVFYLTSKAANQAFDYLADKIDHIGSGNKS